MGNKQAIHFDFNNMMAEMIGSEHGITDHDLKDIKPVASEYVKNIKEERSAGKLQFLDLPYNKKTVEEVLKTVASIKGKFRNLVVVGIGGSALGNIAIHTALNHPFHNLLTDVERNNTLASLFSITLTLIDSADSWTLLHQEKPCSILLPSPALQLKPCPSS